jgi:hypothetical protein
MAPSRLPPLQTRLEYHLTGAIPANSAQTGEFGLPPVSQVRDNLADYIVESVGRFGWSDTRLASDPFHDFRLRHPISTLASRVRKEAPEIVTSVREVSWNQMFISGAKDLNSFVTGT